MSEVLSLRVVINRRLSLAVEEILELFETRIAEYEEEICRQRKLLDAVLKPEVRLHKTDNQLLLVSRKEVPHEQLDWISSVIQDDSPKPSYIKEELWTSQEGDNPLVQEEADITKLTFTPDPVKREDEEETPQSSQLHQRQTEQMELETDVENCEEPEPARDSNPHRYLQPYIDVKTSHIPETEEIVCYDWEKISEPQLALQFGQKNSICNNDDKPFSCSECGKQFSQKSNLKTHMIIHKGEKSFSCSVCCKSFTGKVNLTQHMTVHKGEQRHSCMVCSEGFNWPYQLKNHQCVGHQSSHLHQSRTEQLEAGEDDAGPETMQNFSLQGVECTMKISKSQKQNGIQTAVKRFRCSVCGKSYRQKYSLTDHMRIHSGGKRFSCSVCKRSFQYRVQIVRHMRSHTGEKPFSCYICGRGFAISYNLTSHLRVHSGEKPFSCSICKASFTRRYNLSKHMKLHTGEKPFSCSVCGKTFTRKEHVKQHLTVHERREMIMKD